ncbi:alpha-ribazole phosphatase [uncultured Algibacter sp.]|uniref:alpha-ribazole phosphatase n=1 Tax=uncultured Algibacter sp. TaxID=298659 RepID=UPI0026030C4B|nr:alpha-ribazole phosphatase [uncultured Algibacter sp.]
MEIYLVRHTTPKIKKGICYGHSDLELDDNHDEEFKVVKSKIPTLESFKIISSPLKRCALLAKQFSNDVVFDSRLKELHFGDWEMKPWNDIPEKDLTPWMSDFVTVSVPKGESYTQLASRVTALFEEILFSETAENLIIISHAGPIRAFLSTLLKIDLKDSFNIKINYGDVFHIKKEVDTFNLITAINI